MSGGSEHPLHRGGHYTTPRIEHGNAKRHLYGASVKMRAVVIMLTLAALLGAMVLSEQLRDVRQAPALSGTENPGSE